jgi:aldose sugar dehydrogenase
MDRRVLYQFPLHALAAAALLLVPALWLELPLWRATESTLLMVGAFAATYFVAAVALVVSHDATARFRPGRAMLAGLGAIGAAFLLLAIAVWWRPGFTSGKSPLILLVSSALSLFFLVGLAGSRAATGIKLAVMVAVVLAGIAGQLRLAKSSLEPKRDVAYVDSSLYALKVTTHRNSFHDGNLRGGGIVAMGDDYLVSDGGGRLYHVREDEGTGAAGVRTLAYRVPFNPADYEAGARKLLGAAWQGRADAYNYQFRVADIQLRLRDDGSFRLYASHHFWKVEEGCAVVRVSVLDGRLSELLDPAGALSWRTLHETSPCLTLNTGGRGIVFGALQIGGAMGILSDGELLLAVGDHEFDGWNRSPELPQDPASPYGKILLIHDDTGRAEVYSLGHRNPQGLVVDSAGSVWETEHGPRGGDELNRITRDANYGWPRVTYGTEYSIHHWPLNSAPGRHDGFENPMLAFVPSLGLTGVIAVSGPGFPAWRGDLLLVSLDGEMVRVRVVGDRPVLEEHLKVGRRVRDIAQGKDGRIALWTDLDELVFIEPTDADSGEALVFQCTSCHTLHDWEDAAIGPNLHSVVGRRVGAERDFEYSSAMKNAGGRWTKDRLDSFLANPSAAVPGTTMVFAGMPDAEHRRQLIDYLERRVRD